MKKQVFEALVATLLLLFPLFYAGAYDFYIDDLLITKPGNVWYNDTFADGTPPPMGVPFSSPGWMGNYIGNGLFPPGAGSFPSGTEANGKLHFDSQYAALAGVTAKGYTAWVQNARLKAWHEEFPGQSPIPAANYLFKSDIFQVSARFDLISPAEGEAYTLRLYDPGNPSPSPSGGFIELRVRRDFGSSGASVEFRRGDYYQDGGKTWFTPQDLEPDIPLDLTHGWDQIILTFDHPAAGKEVTASFKYYDLDSNTFSAPNEFAAKGMIFSTDTQPWTDVEFQASRSLRVAEPMSLVLFGIGLAGLAGLRRKMK